MAGHGPAGVVSRSLARRLVLGMGLLALAAMAILYATIFWVSSNAITKALATTVDTDMAGLADIYASGGEAELIARLRDREELVSINGRRAYYLLVGANGRRLAGNIGQWPRMDANRSEQGYIAINDGVPAYARATRLSADLTLLVARDYRGDTATLAQLSWTFVAVAGALLLAAIVIGRFASARLMARIATITVALQRGDGAALEPTWRRKHEDDEISLLARTSGALIGRANRLAETHRHMSDHIAHEVRTPLMHLDNRLVAALRDGPPPAELNHQLGEARRDIRRIAALLDSLLDIAANEARRGDSVGLSTVDLSELATELAELYQGSMEDSGLSLVTTIEPYVKLEGEAMQLTRLMSNLLDNAIKYVPTGGTVTFKVNSGPVIEIADNGPGIEPDLRTHLFERFRRGAVHSTRGGHGLGLALARAVCERHGLTIAALDNHPGVRFEIKPEPVQ